MVGALINVDAQLCARREVLSQANARGTAAKMVSPSVGDQYGELPVRECIGRRPSGLKIWILSCACGWEAIRDTSALNVAIRRGRSPQCSRCLSETRRGAAHVRSLARAQCFRELWTDAGVLWSYRATADLTADVLSDLEAEFGPSEEWSPGLDAMTLDGRLTWIPPRGYGADKEDRERREAERLAADTKKWKRLIGGKVTRPLLDFANRDADKERRGARARKAVATKRRRALESQARTEMP